jgi:CDP-diacylglycerol--glycerol-3-phosphate 3-phosphatidyltransferase
VAGVVVQAAGAWLIVRGAIVAAGFVTIAAGLFDVLDGAVAKAQGRQGKFGALLDSTTDRVSDGLILASVAWLYGVDPDVARHDEPWVAAAALGTLIASYLVSYVKARAEGLGYSCDVGIAERAERLMIVIAGLLFDLLPVAIAILGALSVVTFAQRVVHVRGQDRRSP